jgi:hypothetical protein
MGHGAVAIHEAVRYGIKVLRESHGVGMWRHLQANPYRDFLMPDC